MSENLSQIGRVDPGGNKISPGAASLSDYSHLSSSKQISSRPANSSENVQAFKSSDETRSEEVSDRSQSSSGVMDIGIQYKVDKKTNDVTIVILDKTNQRIIRTIPAEDIAKFKDKGLFELFA